MLVGLAFAKGENGLIAVLLPCGYGSQGSGSYTTGMVLSLLMGAKA